jgi:hypothetical protein
MNIQRQVVNIYLNGLNQVLKNVRPFLRELGSRLLLLKYPTSSHVF